MGGRRLRTERRRAWLAGLILLASSLAGCVGWRPVKVPMDSILDLAACQADGPRATTLLVMLPGAYDTPQDFLREGFVSAVRERQLAVDVQLVDAHVGYYTQQSIVERLRQDVIETARRQGYRQIWLAGISIGGMGSLLYAATHPSDIDGVVALAPYLGPRNISAEVDRAGGLRQWPRDQDAWPQDEADRRLWRWLKSRADDHPRPSSPLLYWGYGLDDRFALGHRVVAQALPPGQVFTVQGGHDWPAWIALWRQLLGQLPWPVQKDSCRLDVRHTGEQGEASARPQR